MPVKNLQLNEKYRDLYITIVHQTKGIYNENCRWLITSFQGKAVLIRFVPDEKKAKGKYIGNCEIDYWYCGIYISYM